MLFLLHIILYMNAIGLYGAVLVYESFIIFFKINTVPKLIRALKVICVNN